MGRLLVGRQVIVSVGEPWDFESPDGPNALSGRITGAAATEVVEDQEVALEVTPFPAKGGTETRAYRRADGSVTERGPYWYFRFHEGGRQRKLYLGKATDPESALAKRRGGGGGE